METKIEVKEMPDMKAVYCRHMGAFKAVSYTHLRAHET